jgi:hypothetical protein
MFVDRCLSFCPFSFSDEHLAEVENNVFDHDTISRSTALEARMQHSNHYTIDVVYFPVMPINMGLRGNGSSYKVTTSICINFKTGGELMCHFFFIALSVLSNVYLLMLVVSFLFIVN